MSEGKPICTRAVLDADAYVRAFRLHGGYRAIALRVVGFLAGLGFIVGAVYALFIEQGTLALLLAIIGIVGITRSLLLGFQQRNSIAKQLGQMQKEVESVHYEIGADHLHIETKEGTANVEWSKFRKWKERHGLIIAYRHDENFVILPVGQMDSAAADLIRDRLHVYSRRV